MIAYDGTWLLGRPTRSTAEGTMLEDVLDFSVNITMTPMGQAVQFIAAPLMLIDSINTWKLPPSAKMWPVKGCSAEQQIRAAIMNGQLVVRKLRAARSGVLLASEMPKMRTP